jgi:hypothetical protein
MRMRLVHRGGATGVVVAATLVLGAMPVTAAPGDSSAYAANVAVALLGASAVNSGPLTSSNTRGPANASLTNVNVAGLVTAGVTTSSVTLDQESGVVRARADIADVGLGLAALTGKIGAGSVTCDATHAGVNGNSTLADVAIPDVGVSPYPVPNTTVNLPSAKIVFNEQVRGDDGSLTVNAAHIYLNAVVGSGEVVLAQARCGPAAPPIPLASGAGLWLGLGLLVLAAIPAALLIRKRRTAIA